MFYFNSCSGTPSLINVVAGTNYLNTGGDRYGVSAIFTHANYSSSEISNDIALLRLSSAVQYSANVSAVNLPSSNIGAGENVVLAGWGTTSYPGNVPNSLQQLNLTTLSVAECQQRQNPNPVFDSQVCTLTQAGEGACHGDSGGPLVSSGNVLQGIVSWGIPCAEGYPDVFTRVYAFLPWIENIIAANSV